jgi:hypothetical protein
MAWVDTNTGFVYNGDQQHNDHIKIDNRPTINHIFDLNSLEWVIDTNKVVQQQLKEIKDMYAAKIDSGCITTVKDASGSAIRVDCTERSYLLFSVGLKRAQRNGATGIVVKDYHNNYHPVSLSDLDTIINNIEDYQADCLEWKWTEENAVVGG